MSAAQPITQAFLLCDRVITEKDSNKKTLVGVFGIMRAPAFPIRHHNLALFYRAIIEKGEYAFRINFCPKGSMTPLSHVEGKLRVGRSDIPTELVVNLPFLEVPEPGEYEFRLWIDDAYVHRVGLTVAKLDLEGRVEHGD